VIVQRLAERLPRRFFCYTGALGPLQGVDVMIKALARVDGDLGLVVVGAGRDEEDLKALAAKNNRVVFVGQQSPGVAKLLVTRSRAAIMNLGPSPLDETAIPSKLAAYLSAGVPVIVAANGASASLARSASAGPTIPPNNIESMRTAFEEVRRKDDAGYNTWRDNARSFSEKHLTFERSVDAVARLFESALS